MLLVNVLNLNNVNVNSDDVMNNDVRLNNDLNNVDLFNNVDNPYTDSLVRSCSRRCRSGGSET